MREADTQGKTKIRKSPVTYPEITGTRFRDFLKACIIGISYGQRGVKVLPSETSHTPVLNIYVITTWLPLEG